METGLVVEEERATLLALRVGQAPTVELVLQVVAMVVMEPLAYRKLAVEPAPMVQVAPQLMVLVGLEQMVYLVHSSLELQAPPEQVQMACVGQVVPLMMVELVPMVVLVRMERLARHLLDAGVFSALIQSR